MKNYFIFLLVLSICGCATRGFPPEHQIVNFDRVTMNLYRGGQPTRAAIDWLSSIGVKSIINLRQTNDVLKAEPQECILTGIQYTNIPLSGVLAPTQTQMETVLDALQKMPRPIFIHCQHGCERTGTCVACYEIRAGAVANKQALQEAEQYAISPFAVGMKNFIKHFK